VELLKEHMTLYPPSHFKNWNPVTKHYYDKLNREWATSEKYKQLGECFEIFLQKSIANFDSNGLFLNKNRPNTIGGSYMHKRYVRIGSKGYHQNGLQIFIESFSEKASEDSSIRDPSDRKYQSLGFPIPENHMGIFIGMSAISYFENGQKWGMEERGIDFDTIRENFYELEEKMEAARDWALHFTGSGDDFRVVQNERIQRIRIKLPYLSLDSEDWEECKIQEGLNNLVEIFINLFVEFSKQE